MQAQARPLSSLLALSSNPGKGAQAHLLEFVELFLGKDLIELFK